jgi:pyruvate dehydrogenase E1 component
MDASIATLREIERQVLWTACWTIHNANHLRPKIDGDVKVGGHQASSASLAAIMTALYFHVLRPEDRVAVKPHASPIFHAIQYLAGQQTRENLENFRGFGGAQSYPSRTKDVDDVDFSTGSVGLGVGITAFASMVQDYIAEKAWSKSKPLGRMIALVGDAELDEGNIFECLQEGWKHGLRNCWWIIDYNRQSLDGVVHEGLWARIEAIFAAFGWNVVTLKHGALQQQLFARPGGQRLKVWIDSCPNAIFSALTFQGGSAWRARLSRDFAADNEVLAIIGAFDDDRLADAMTDLGGHCMATLIHAFSEVQDDRPTLFLAYTIKGKNTPLAGHKDNHAGLMTPAQMAQLQQALKVPEAQEWEPFCAVSDPTEARRLIQSVPFFSKGMRRIGSARIEVPPQIQLTDKVISTQGAFGKLLDEIARAGGPLADRLVTTAPDVTVSTNLGGFVNRRGLFGREWRSDTFREHNIPSAQKWAFSPQGQHIELGIAEMNLFLLLGALGLSHSLFGERLIPIGTVYDPFVVRGLDALNYACYQDARFIIAGTPSGITLAPEGGAHQSINTPLIGIAQDGLASFEPCWADELATIMFWAFDYLQRSSKGVEQEKSWLREETGGSVYLRLSTRPIEQLLQRNDAAFCKGVIDGGYWLRKPGPNSDVVIAYQGCLGPEAIEAAGRIGNDRRDVGVLAVTSADRLNAGWSASRRARRRGQVLTRSHIDSLLDALPSHCRIITVCDGHPLTLAWLGAVAGHRVIPLGVEHFGQSGTIPDLYRHFGIDADAIVAAADAHAAGRPIRLSRA